ncbi:hypothetical protein [Haloferula sp.]|uniref:hypothetical protein n=1 Tax=Haloferula sp. TaxID=2497595 RepID=UPI003C78AB4E
MNPDSIVTLQVQFDQLVQIHPEEAALEFWFARDLQAPLGYARWENFMTAIQRAIDSCKTTGYDPEHHFRGVTKMVPLGSGAERPVEDFMLTREHVQNNHSVREMLGQRGIKAENLPPEEDIKKLERRVKAEEKKIESKSGRIPKD